MTLVRMLSFFVGLFMANTAFAGLECSTASSGLVFKGNAPRVVVAACKSHRNTNNAQCERNVVCVDRVEQGLPRGSYRLTCAKADMRGPILSAYCKTMRGYVVFTQLNTNLCRPASDIGNNNGQLQCAYR